MYKKRLKIFFIALLFISIGVNAQNKNGFFNQEYGVQFYEGIIIPHYKSINYLKRYFPKAINLTINFPSYGEKYWHKKFKYPDKGFGYNFVDFGNPTNLGYGHSLFAFINLPLLRKKYFLLNLDGSFGAAYITKPFNIDSNYDNFIIGSHANAFLRVYANAKFFVSEKLSLKVGFGISHYSNGAIKKPNKGINMLAVYTEIAFLPKKKAMIEPSKIDKFEKSIDFSGIFSLGWKQGTPPYSRLYGLGAFSLVAEYNSSEISRVGVGIDVFYDEIYAVRTPREIYENKTKNNAFFTGVHVSYDLVFGKSSFTFQAGAHPTKPASSYPIIFQRFGLKQRIGKHFVCGVSLKSYMGTAQFIEWRTGYYFTKK